MASCIKSHLKEAYLIQSAVLLFGTEGNVSCNNGNLQSVFKTALLTSKLVNIQCLSKGRLHLPTPKVTSLILALPRLLNCHYLIYSNIYLCMRM